MAHVPASCSNCGLLFPSGIGASVGLKSLNNATRCPRCGSIAGVLNGYIDLIKGVATFIMSPEHPRELKEELIAAARSAARDEVLTGVAAKLLEQKNPTAGEIIRSWGMFGFTGLAALATAATFLLGYYESGKNEPPEQAVMEEIDRFLTTEPQPQYKIVDTPAPSPSTLQPHPKKRQRNGAEGRSPNENRKARRARLAKVKKQGSKPLKK